MNTRDKIALVKKSVEQLKQYDKMSQKLYFLTGYSPESDFAVSVSAMYQNIIELTALCIDDVGEFLDWYVYENQFGSRGNTVEFCGVRYPVETEEQLVYIIEMYYDTIGGDDVCT